MYNWRDPNRVSAIQNGADHSEAKVFWAHARTARCARISRVLQNCWPVCKKGRDTLVDTIFEGFLQEQNRLKITDERRFIDVDNHEAVKKRRSGEGLEGDQRGQLT